VHTSWGISTGSTMIGGKGAAAAGAAGCIACSSLACQFIFIRGVYIPNHGIVIPKLLMQEGTKEEVNTFSEALTFIYFVCLSCVSGKNLILNKTRFCALCDIRIIV